MSDQSANKSNNPDEADPPPEQGQRLIINALIRKWKVPCNLQHSGNVVKQVHDLFGAVPDFLDTADLPVFTWRKLIDICGQPQQQALLKIELAATVDAMEPLVKATYNLERGVPLALRVNQELRTVESSIANAYYPNITTVSCLLSQGNVLEQQQWVNYAMQCMQHIKITKTNLFKVHFSHWSWFSKSCRLFDPIKVK